MTDVQRLFQALVRNLAASDPTRLRQPLLLKDIRDSIVPYRGNRRSLQLESSEDYELALMQLCAGEGGFAMIGPEDVRSLFAAEIQSTNPDLALLHLHEKALVKLEAAPLAEALNGQPDLAFAPPVQMAGDGVAESSTAKLQHVTAPDSAEASPTAAPRSHSSVSHCSRCGDVLPTRAMVKFCPHCGANQTHRRCPQCENELEAGWRHCVTCGFLVG